ncbi:uncharacterized protein LOC129350084 [Amphiprion ocellaris]|uniref:uncharacterized protein LOC129350084 n=1 Tax=Amphiprion ocellaris TaxID=80972 RepID=UPI0024117117|nr:uncharacterized protein LOC129350084 [Amphiprion ocellaris]
MLGKVCDLNKEIYFLGGLNIDWGLNNCSLKNKLCFITNTCNLSQVVTKPTRVSYRSDGTKSAKCIDLLFTNARDLCSNAISNCVGASDHNLIAINRKTKVPKSGQKIVIKRIFKYFDEESYCADVRRVDWSQVMLEEDPDTALEVFTNLIMPIIDKHAPLKRMTVRNIACPWVDAQLKEYFKQRDGLKAEAILSGDIIIWERYKQLRNYITKLNRAKKRAYYENKFREVKSDSKKTWNTLNEVTGRKSKCVPSFLELEHSFLTRPADIAKYLSEYFKNKVDNLKKNTILNPKSNLGYSMIKNNILKNKSCSFSFDRVSVTVVNNALKLMKVKPAGMDELDVRLLKLVSDVISIPVCHIINTSLLKCKCPVKWKVASP